MPLPEDLLALLVCAECLGDLTEVGDELVCTDCGLRYPVRDGIPIMLPEAATRGHGTR